MKINLDPLAYIKIYTWLGKGINRSLEICLPVFSSVCTMSCLLSSLRLNTLNKFVCFKTLLREKEQEVEEGWVSRSAKTRIF